MGDERSVVDRALDVGAGFDWITPAYALLRGGQVFGVMADDMPEVQRLLSAEGISAWAWQVLWDGSAYMAYFNVADDDAPAVRELLGYAEPAAAATSGGGSAWWMWAAVAAVFVVALTLGALWATAGGGL